jgi:malate synthase
LNPAASNCWPCASSAPSAWTPASVLTSCRTAHIRNGDWKIAPIPKALECRRVEITGPVERKMVINALNSGADSYMTDFEDSNTPNWDNQITARST